MDKQKKLQKLAKLAKILEQGSPAIARFLFELEDKLEQAVTELSTVISSVSQETADRDDELKKEFDDIKPTDERLVEIIRPLIPEVKDGLTPSKEELLALIKPLIPQVENGKTPSKEDLLSLIKPLIPEIDTDKIVAEAVAIVESRIKLPSKDELVKEVEDKVSQNIPKLGEPIRDSLELLEGKNRLDKSAIRGLDDYDEIADLARQERTIVKKYYGGGASGADKFTSLLDTFSDYSGLAGKGLRVNATEDGIDTYTPTDSDEKVKLNASDATAGYLDDKIGGYGFLTSETDPVFSAWLATVTPANWDTAYGWGNHADAGYALSSALASYVPYTGATTTLDLGSNTLKANKIIKKDGLATEFLKADGSVDSNTYENTANKAQNNGYCDLDNGGKVPLGRLPSTLLKYVGVWNASTNTPTLTENDVTKKGNVYNVGTAGTQFGIDFNLGDWAIYNDDGNIEKSDNSDDVTSVNGQQGSVVLDADDIDDTSTTNKFVTDTEKGNFFKKDTDDTDTITDTKDNRFTNDTDVTRLSETSGLNTGDQAPMKRTTTFGKTWNTGDSVFIKTKQVFLANENFVRVYEDDALILSDNFNNWEFNTPISGSSIGKVNDLADGIRLLNPHNGSVYRIEFDEYHIPLSPQLALYRDDGYMVSRNLPNNTIDGDNKKRGRLSSINATDGTMTTYDVTYSNPNYDFVKTYRYATHAFCPNFDKGLALPTNWRIEVYKQGRKWTGQRASAPGDELMTMDSILSPTLATTINSFSTDFMLEKKRTGKFRIRLRNIVTNEVSQFSFQKIKSRIFSYMNSNYSSPIPGDRIHKTTLD